MHCKIKSESWWEASIFTVEPAQWQYGSMVGALRCWFGGVDP